MRSWGDIAMQGDVPTGIRFVPLAHDEAGQIIDPPHDDEGRLLLSYEGLPGAASFSLWAGFYTDF